MAATHVTVCVPGPLGAVRILLLWMTTTVADLPEAVAVTARAATAVTVTTIVHAARAETTTTIAGEVTGHPRLVGLWTTTLPLVVAMMTLTAETTQLIRTPLTDGLRMIGHHLLATSRPVMVLTLLETMGILRATVDTSVVVVTDHGTSHTP